MYAPLRQSAALLLLLSTLLSSHATAATSTRTAPSVTAGATPFITSIDTMKESRDTLNNPLTNAQIMDDVTTTASLGARYITVDVPYDYPDYMRRWVDAARTAGLHVWFRSTFDAWEGIYTATATMTPTGYIAALSRFIVAHPDLYRPGDILDPLPEPENGPYWARVSPYGSSWTWLNAPNATTDEYNTFFVNLSHATDAALAAVGVAGVITTVRSTNGYIAARPSALYPSTVAAMGRVTTDSYVGQDTAITPALALQAVQREISGIEAVRAVPLVIGEIGYSIQGLVSDRQQEAVLKPQFDWLRTLPYVQGVNYWHGAGYAAPDTWNGASLFEGTTGAWTPRPAGLDLAAFFAAKTQLSTNEVSALSSTAPPTSAAANISTDTGPLTRAPSATAAIRPAETATDTSTATNTNTSTATNTNTSTATATSTSTAAALPMATNTRIGIPTTTPTSTPASTNTAAPTSTTTKDTPVATATATTSPTASPTTIPFATATSPVIPASRPPTATPPMIPAASATEATNTPHTSNTGGAPTPTMTAVNATPSPPAPPPTVVTTGPVWPTGTATAPSIPADTPISTRQPPATATGQTIPTRVTATPSHPATSPSTATPVATRAGRSTATPTVTRRKPHPTTTPTPRLHRQGLLQLRAATASSLSRLQ